MTINKRAIQTLAVICLWLLSSQLNAQERPNILFLVIEDSSPYLLPAYGNKSIKTPNIDFLAEHGVVFDHAFSNGPHCSPARSSLISGNYATTYGNDLHRGRHLVPQHYFFPQHLREAGYFTVNAGKADYNITAEMRQKYFGMTWDRIGKYRSKKKKNHTYNDPNRGDKPFFAQFNNNTCHMSRITTISTTNRAPSSIPMENVELPAHVPDLPAIRSDYALHLEGVQETDKWVGLFLEDLKEKGLADNTIIFYFSDHGGSLPRGKGFPFETGVRAPLIIYAPAKWQHLLPAQPGTRSEQLVEFADFGPTLLSIAGVKVPKHMNGVPFMGHQAQKRKYAYNFRSNSGMHFDPARMVCDGDYFYVRNFTPYKLHALKQGFQWGMPGQLAWDSAYFRGGLDASYSAYYRPKTADLLFDSDKDPQNLYNLSQERKMRKRVKRLKGAVWTHIEQTGDVGFFPREVREEFVENGIILYDYVRQDNYPLDELHDLAWKAADGKAADIEFFVGYLTHERPEFRFWAVSGLATAAYFGHLIEAFPELKKATNDDTQCVAATAAEAIAMITPDKGIPMLIKQAQASNELSMSALEELGEQVRPYIAEIHQLKEKGKGKAIKFLARGILINLGELSRSELYGEKDLEKYMTNHQNRVKNWAPTIP